MGFPCFQKLKIDSCSYLQAENSQKIMRIENVPKKMDSFSFASYQYVENMQNPYGFEKFKEDQNV